MQPIRLIVSLLLVTVLQTACARDGRVFALMRQGGGGSAVLMANGTGTLSLVREEADAPVDLSVKGEWIAACFLEPSGTYIVETYRSDANLFERHSRWMSPIAIGCIAAETDGGVTGVSQDGTQLVKFKGNSIWSVCLPTQVSPHDCIRSDDGSLLVAQRRGGIRHIAVIHDADAHCTEGTWYFARQLAASSSHWKLRVDGQTRVIGTELTRHGLHMTTYSKPTTTFIRYGTTSARLKSWYLAAPWIVVLP